MEAMHPVAASAPSQEPAPEHRILWTVLAALAGILPTFGVTYAARFIIKMFQSMAAVGSGGIGTVAIGLYEANRPLIVAAIAATLLAGSAAIVLLVRPRSGGAFPGLLLSALVPVAACVPAFLLWRVEAFTIDIVADRITLPVATASTRLSTLLLASLFVSLALSGLLVLGSIISLVRSRPKAASPRILGVVWVVVTLLLAVVAVSFYVRSSYLYDVGMRGSL